MDKDHGLSWIQFTLLIYKTQVGVGILSAARILIDGAGTDGWILVIIGCVISILMGGIILAIMRRYPNQTLYDLLEKFLGRWLGKGFIFIWVIYGLLISTYVVMMTIHLIHIWILPDTKVYLLMLLLIIPIYMITSKGIQLIGRYAEFVFLVASFLPFLILFALQDMDWRNFLPILKDGWQPVLRHIHTVMPFYFGIELAFIWYPFLRDQKKAFRGMVIANLLTFFILMIVTIISLLEFSPMEIKRLVWPTVSLLTFIQFPFLESFEVIVLSLYIYVLLATLIPYLYVAIFGVQKLVKKNSVQIGKWTLVFVLAIWLLLALFQFPSFIKIMQVAPFFEQMGFGMVFGFPILFGLIVLVCEWRKKVRSS